MNKNVLILADEAYLRDNIAFKEAFESRGEFIGEISQLCTILKERAVDLILIPENYREINPGIIRRLRMRSPLADIRQIVRTDRAEIPDDSIYDGYISLAAGRQQIHRKLDRILHQRALLHKFGMVGRSERLKAVAETIERVAPADISILVIGPSGSGKELVARAIHDNSARAGKRFVAVNCGALAEGILESELFGHEKGAFTGSIGKRDGLFVMANGGTILLDEIGETKPDMQVKLLRVLEDGYFYPVGSDRPVHTDARVIAATNRDLSEALGDGSFREDLYFRLGVVKINLPPLLERKEDILPLLFYFASREGLKGFSDAALGILMRYDWPGNVRQLRNFVAGMAALHPGSEISAVEAEKFIAEQAILRKNLPVVTGRTVEEAGHELIYRALLSLGNEIRMLKELILANLPDKEDTEPLESEGAVSELRSAPSLKNMEKALMEKALRETSGNRKAAARILGIGERTLYRKLKEYNLS
jgi:DNA-binding NtrC family response regulator